MLNLRELTEALGYKDKRAALKFMEGVPHCDMGKEKKFLAIDIANRIHSRMEASWDHTSNYIFTFRREDKQHERKRGENEMTTSTLKVEELTDKLLQTIKTSVTNLSCSEAIEALENTIEKVKNIPLKFS
jgi:hypothetical protein